MIWKFWIVIFNYHKNGLGCFNIYETNVMFYRLIFNFDIIFFGLSFLADADNKSFFYFQYEEEKDDDES